MRKAETRLDPTIVVKVPAKVILFGEHAVVDGNDSIVCAINQYLTLRASIILENRLLVLFNGKPLSEDVKYPQFLEKKLLNTFGIMVKITSDERFEIAAGLGSSSCLCVGLATIFLLATNQISSELNSTEQAQIFKLALETERSVNPKCSGVDTAAVVFGGVNLFNGKSKAITPLQSLRNLSLFVIHTGIPHDTKSAVAEVFLNPNRLQIFSSIQNIVENVVKDLPSFDFLDNISRYEEYFHLNNKLLVELGVSCSKADEIIKIVRNSKISGAGKGGILICLRLSKEEEDLLKFENFTFNQVRVSTGVKVQEPGLPLYLSVLQQRIANFFKSVDLTTSPRVGFCSAPANIALLKYWGKEVNNCQMATCPSVSLTLNGFRSFTEVYLVSLLQDINFEVSHDERSINFLERILPAEMDGFRLFYKSHNNFPSSCGIASSASGFCALVGAVKECLTLDKFMPQHDIDYYCKNWTRIGSGSSCRSLYNGFVSWKHQNVNLEIETSLSLNLEHLVVIFNPFPKKIKSSEGHEAADSSIFNLFRVQKAKENVNVVIESLRKYLETDDVEAFKFAQNIIEYDTMTMHAVMKTSAPPADYLSHSTTIFVDEFMKFRSLNSIPAFFTIDAGPNVHLIFRKTYKVRILQFIKSLDFLHWTQVLFSNSILNSGPSLFYASEMKRLEERTDLLNKICRYSCILISGKRYSGKTFVSDRLSKLLDIPSFALSNNIKAVYCDKFNLDVEQMLTNRELKESHRPGMIQFMEDKLKQDPFFWDRMLWEQQIGASSSKVFIVSDARRSHDLDFFGKMSKCFHLRIFCPAEVRIRRGWKESAVDFASSETGLDDFPFDYEFVSDSTQDSEDQFVDLIKAIKKFLA